MSYRARAESQMGRTITELNCVSKNNCQGFFLSVADSNQNRCPGLAIEGFGTVLDPSSSASTPHVFQFLQRLPLFWKFHCGGWLLFFLTMFPARVLITKPEGGAWGTVAPDMLFFLCRDLIAFVLCLGLRWVFHRPFAQKLKPIQLAPLLVGVATLAAALDGVAAEWLFHMMQVGRGNVSAPVFVAASFSLHLILFFFWGLLFFILRSFLRAKRNEKRLALTAARQRESELLMLRAHLEPHFIFNALNAITILSHGNTRVIPVVRGLSDYLRFCLANRDKPLVPLGDELDAIGEYLKVERARFGDDLIFKVDVDNASSRHIPVPGVFMMPLVENAIKHRAPGNHPLYLWIQVDHRQGSGDEAVLEELRMHPVHGERHEQEVTPDLQEVAGMIFDSEVPDFLAMERELIIRVTSNSVWKVAEERVNVSPASGVGLSNLHRRMELLYPGEGRTEFSIGPSEGYVVAQIRIRAPLHAFRNRVTAARPSQPDVPGPGVTLRRDADAFVGMIGAQTPHS